MRKYEKYMIEMITKNKWNCTARKSAYQLKYIKYYERF